jgi:multidrug transporter EmrE-like cation transporter
VSVFASMLGVMVSMEYGIAAAYWAGVGAYVACLAVVFLRRRQAMA